MSTLGNAVRVDLEKRGMYLDAALIEKALTDAAISSNVSRGVPVRLRVRRLQVTGTKNYREDSDDGSAGEMKSAPIHLDWSPVDGINGVGSDKNLRGKSSVLHFTMWALTGRSHLQSDVLSWVDRLRAEFHIDGVPVHVEIKMNDGTPTGAVEQEVHSRRALLGNFVGHDEFEALMGSVMLDRLRLDAISVFARGVETEHSWPTYASALTVHANKLDPIVGNENTLKTRILQMFVGTTWAAAGAQAASARNARTFEGEKIKEERSVAGNVNSTALEAAGERLASARAALAQFDPAEPNVDAVFELASTAAERAQEVHGLSLQLMSARSAASEVHTHLRVEELRQQSEAEDAIARRLFNGMTPTACPRCSHKVTAERYEAEKTDHECSLCNSDLDVSVDEEVQPQDSLSTNGEASGLVGDSADDEDAADPVTALRVAATEADDAVAKLTVAFEQADAVRKDSEAAVQIGRESLESARSRLRIEMQLARAEGAFEAIERSFDQAHTSEPTFDDVELEILRSAERLTAGWLKADQDPLLESVSENIADLARRFGSTNITSVSLKGNGNMDVFKGGAKSGYSGLTNGEKLRIKLAAAIALIELGHKHGVGRHPGLLFVDSPAAEEIPEVDLKKMIEALAAVARETDLQIVVATTHGPMLRAVLPKEGLLVAMGTDFVW